MTAVEPNPVERTLGAALEVAIQSWVRLTGRPVRLGSAPWLEGPIGGAVIGDGVYDAYAAEAGLLARRTPDQVAFGLLPDFGALRGPRFDPDAVHAGVRDFYERTGDYALQVGASWRGLFAHFARTIVYLVSRTIEQLNLPLSPDETSLGMSSELIALVDPGTGAHVLSGWLRRSPSTGRVVYAGFYGAATPPLGPGPCVKVVFPLPGGSTTVLLRPEHDGTDGLRLVSAGHRFGGPGYYRLHRTANSLRARMIPIEEVIHVYVDERGTLRTEHTFAFWRFRFLTLSYVIVPRGTGDRPASAV